MTVTTREVTVNAVGQTMLGQVSVAHASKLITDVNVKKVSKEVTIRYIRMPTAASTDAVIVYDCRGTDNVNYPITVIVADEADDDVSKAGDTMSGNLTFGAANELIWGADSPGTKLSRLEANHLYDSSQFSAASNITARFNDATNQVVMGYTASGAGLRFGNPVDVEFFRAGAGQLKTAGSLTGVTGLYHNTTRAQTAQAKHVYVVASGGNDSNDGLTWTTAKSTIGSAITAVGATGGVINLGPGTIAMGTTGVNIPVFAQGGLIIQGCGTEVTDVTYTGTDYAFTLGDGGATQTRYVTLRDFAFSGDAANAGAIKFNHAQLSTIERIYFSGCSGASAKYIYMAGAATNQHNYHNVIRHCYFAIGAYGIYLDWDTTLGANSNWVIHNLFTCTTGVYIKGNSNWIMCNEFDGSTTTAVELAGTGDRNKILYNQNDGPTNRVIIGATNDLTVISGNTGGGTYTDNSGTTNWQGVQIHASATWDPGSIAASGIATTTVTTTGAVAGDVVHVGPPAAIDAGLLWSAYVSSANTVTIRLFNSTAGAIDPASATWKVVVTRHQWDG